MCQWVGILSVLLLGCAARPQSSAAHAALDLFAHPDDDAAELALRTREWKALRASVAREKCARSAALLRQERLASLPSAAAAYERANELNEGLASYVEQMALGGPAPLPAEAPADLRQRLYLTGAAIAALLDRLAPGWKDALEAGADASLDAVSWERHGEMFRVVLR